MNYQGKVYLKALEYTRKRELAVDIGAHVGIFTTRMERDFEEVYSFEPARDNFRCLVENTSKARLFNCCVWSVSARLGMRFEDHHNSGANEVYGEGLYPAIALDSFGLSPDLIKMDIQGSELEALKGSQTTLLAKPVLIIEGVTQEIEALLGGIGYAYREKFGKDQIWT